MTAQAIADLPMGPLAKIALQFDSLHLGFAPNAWLDYWVPRDMAAPACFFLTRPFGFDYMVGFFGAGLAGTCQRQVKQRRSISRLVK